MSRKPDVNSGGAIVLVYNDGILSRQLFHEHDGGRAYMEHLLRQAIKYARTHYEAGDIVKVLKSEVEFECGEETLGSTDSASRADHLYYITSTYSPRKCRREYKVYAAHSVGLAGLTPFPETEMSIPVSAEAVL